MPGFIPGMGVEGTKTDDFEVGRERDSEGVKRGVKRRRMRMTLRIIEDLLLSLLLVYAA